jgi:hypothetical protein
VQEAATENKHVEFPRFSNFAPSLRLFSVGPPATSFILFLFLAAKQHMRVTMHRLSCMTSPFCALSKLHIG